VLAEQTSGGLLELGSVHPGHLLGPGHSPSHKTIIRPRVTSVKRILNLTVVKKCETMGCPGK
jgi:hypothetical protein